MSEEKLSVDWVVSSLRVMGKTSKRFLRVRWGLKSKVIKINHRLFHVVCFTVSLVPPSIDTMCVCVCVDQKNRNLNFMTEFFWRFERWINQAKIFGQKFEILSHFASCLLLKKVFNEFFRKTMENDEIKWKFVWRRFSFNAQWSIKSEAKEP